MSKQERDLSKGRQGQSPSSRQPGQQSQEGRTGQMGSGDSRPKKQQEGRSRDSSLDDEESSLGSYSKNAIFRE